MPAIRYLALLILVLSCLAAASRADDAKPDVASIERKSLEILQEHVPHPSKSGEINLPDETKIIYGSLFDDGVVALVNFFPRPINDAGFDYPPCFLSLARYSKNAWHYVQYLGSASRFKIDERKDLKLKIVQGWCRTGRNEGKQASWKWETTKRRLISTGMDDWGPYYIAGNFVVYQRGAERLAHWDTRWVRRFENGKAGDLVACYHEEDVGRWTISFKLKPGDKEFTHWAFLPEFDHPENVKVCSVADEEAFGGDELAQLKLPKGEELGQGYCFELLTGLSSLLLESIWVQKLAKPDSFEKRPKIEATGDPEVVTRFQWPPKK